MEIKYSKRKAVFRAEGNAQIGYGHFVRTLGVLSMVKEYFYCVYAIESPTDFQISEMNKVCDEIKVLHSGEELSDEFLDFLEGDELVILDNYFFTSAYQLKIKDKGCDLIYIDDFNEKYFICDALINNIPGFLESDFKRAKYTRLYLGTDYALLRQEFLNPEWRHVEKEPRKIFLSFGGADKFNLSLKIAQFLVNTELEISINVLIGDSYEHRASLDSIKGITIHKNISAGEVAYLMASSSLCIVPASSLVNEAASIGCKLIVGHFTDNQLQPYRYFVENDLALGCGDYRALMYDEFHSVFIKAQMSEFLIDNQRRIYRFQQTDNIRNIFKQYV